MKLHLFRLLAYVLDLIHWKHRFHRRAGAIVAARTRKANRAALEADGRAVLDEQHSNYNADIAASLGRRP